MPLDFRSLPNFEFVARLPLDTVFYPSKDIYIAATAAFSYLKKHSESRALFILEL